VQLAALSDSLDYIADAIAHSGEQRTAGGNPEVLPRAHILAACHL
jgi:hypothetical protein